MFAVQQIEIEVHCVNESDAPIKTKIAELKRLDEKLAKIVETEKE